MNTDAPLGSIDNPVKCDRSSGEIEYLRRLSGPDHQPLIFSREGSSSSSSSPNMLDIISIQSQLDDSVSLQIYMDMYHPGYQEQRPVYDLRIMSSEELERLAEMAESQREDLDSIIRITNAMKKNNS